MSKNKKDSEAICHWSARRLSPKILAYVALIFIAFIAISYWGFHSLSAVKTLGFAAVASIVPLLPMVFSRIEYQLTQQKLESRPLNKKEAKPYATLFLLDQISYLVFTSSGFKFYLILEEKSRLLKFWKRHILEKYSGEVKIEKPDAERVIAEIEKLGVLIKGKAMPVN